MRDDQFFDMIMLTVFQIHINSCFRLNIIN